MTPTGTYGIPGGARFRRHELDHLHLVAVLDGAMAEPVAKGTEHFTRLLHPRFGTTPGRLRRMGALPAFKTRGVRRH
jgi:hypothetical protein